MLKAKTKAKILSERFTEEKPEYNENSRRRND